MSVSPAQCPTPDDLEGIALGREASPELRDHLESCDACRRTLQRIRDDNRFLSEFAVSGALPDRPALRAGGLDTDAAPDIPGFDVLREIHRGGQGVVYQAVQRSTKREVAIKVMKQGPFATLSDRTRFEREVETLGKLDHPNIVAVHDAGVAAGFHYFVMNYVDGMPLDEYAANVKTSKSQNVKIRELLALFAKVCDAVHAAHLRGVIHRDLKPSNVRVDRGGEPFVLDFGLARSIDARRDSAMTRTGQFVGSLPWASPEQVEGVSSGIDLRTDVYSLGAILFQLLTGVLPFDVGSNLRDALDNILRVEPPRPSGVRTEPGRGPQAGNLVPFIDDELDTIVLKCLSKDRERRYQSAGELAQDLRHYLADEPIYAKRDSAWYVLRKSANRHRHLIGAIAAGSFLLAVGLGAALYSALDARTARARESLERAKAMSEAAKTEAVTQVMRVLVPHADLSFDPDNIRPAQQALDRLVARMEGGMLGAQPQVEAAVRSMLASVYREGGMLAQADWEYREALRINTVAWGDENLDVALSLNNLADLLLERNGIPEAERYCRRGLEVRRRLLGPAHRDVAQSFDTLARILLVKGELTAAAEAGEPSLRIRQSVLGEEHSDVAQSLDTLARVFTAQRRGKDAVDHARRSLGIRLRRLNDEHPAVIAGLRTMADAATLEPTFLPSAATELRELADALGGTRGAPGLTNTDEMWQRLARLKQALLGEEHPSVAQTLMALGSAQRTQSRLADARATFGRALHIFRKAHGDGDLTVAEALYHYCLAIENDCPGLVAASRERAGIYERQLRGTNDMAIIVAIRELADRLWTCSEYAAAEVEYRRTISLAKELLGPVHREVAWCMSHFAELLLARGRLDEAERLAKESVAMLDQIDRAPGMPRSHMLFALGSVLFAQGRYAEAEPRLLEAASGMARFNPGRSEHRRTIQKIVDLYDAWGRRDQAAHWRRIAQSSQPAPP